MSASAAVHITVASSLYGGVLRKRALTYLVNDTVLAVSVVVVISASQELDTQQNAMRLRLDYVFRRQQLLSPLFLLLNGGFHHRCRRTKWKNWVIVDLHRELWTSRCGQSISQSSVFLESGVLIVIGAEWRSLNSTLVYINKYLFLHCKLRKTFSYYVESYDIYLAFSWTTHKLKTGHTSDAVRSYKRPDDC